MFRYNLPLYYLFDARIKDVSPRCCHISVLQSCGLSRTVTYKRLTPLSQTCISPQVYSAVAENINLLDKNTMRSYNYDHSFSLHKTEWRKLSSALSHASSCEAHDKMDDNLPQSVWTESNILSPISPGTLPHSVIPTYASDSTRETFNHASSPFKSWKVVSDNEEIDYLSEICTQAEAWPYHPFLEEAEPLSHRKVCSSTSNTAIIRGEEELDTDFDFPDNTAAILARLPLPDTTAVIGGLPPPAVDFSLGLQQNQPVLREHGNSSALKNSRNPATDLCDKTNLLLPRALPKSTHDEVLSSSKIQEPHQLHHSPCGSILSVGSTWHRMTDDELCAQAQQAVPQERKAFMFSDSTTHSRSVIYLKKCDMLPEKVDYEEGKPVDAETSQHRNAYGDVRMDDDGTEQKVSTGCARTVRAGYYSCESSKERLTRAEQIKNNKITEVDSATSASSTEPQRAVSATVPYVFPASQSFTTAGSSYPSTRTIGHIIPCPLCFKRYRGEQNLRRHMTRVHTGLPKRRPLRKECDICHEKMLQGNLKAHTKVVHGKAAKHFCMACNHASFSSKRAYTRHLRVMHGAKSPCCTATRRIRAPCPMSGCCHVASSWSNIQRHVEIVHMKLKKHECKRCGGVFGTKSNLEVHECTA